MLSREALRQAAQTTPAVLVDSAQLLELLDAADRAPKARKPRNTAQQDKDAADDEKCARWLYGVLLTTMPKAKQPNIESWAKDIRLMRERDKRTRREICELFQWAHDHSFWRSNILSPAKLRDQWDRLAIQRATAAEPKKQGGNWWATDETILAKGRELGIAPRSGEYMGQFKARIEAILDPSNEPKVAAAPPVAAPAIRPTLAPPPVTGAQGEPRARKPEGMGSLKDLVRKVVLPVSAP